MKYPGASLEVREHHWQRHLQECPDANDLANIMCPCPDENLAGVAQMCTTCCQVIFVLVGDEPCCHVAHLLDPLMAAGWGLE